MNNAFTIFLSRIPIWAALIWCVIIVTIRILTEVLILNPNVVFTYHIFMHHFAWFASIILLLSAAMHLILKCDYLTSLKTFFIGSVVIFIPVLTALLTHGSPSLDYLKGDATVIIKSFLSFGFMNESVPLGLSIELCMIFISLSIFGIFMTRSLYKGLFFSVAAYTLIAMIGSLPMFIGRHYWMQSGEAVLNTRPLLAINTFFNNHKFYMSINLVILISAIAILFILISRGRTISFLRDLRLSRLPIIVFTSLFGALYAPIFIGYDYLILLLGLSFLWVYSVVINNISDATLDAHKNRNVMLSVYSQKALIITALVSVVMFILFVSVKYSSIIVGVLALVTAISVTIYSLPPIRLKRTPLGMLFESFAFSNCFLFGYFWLDGTIHPAIFQIYAGLFISYLCAIPVKDIKDQESDKKYGIITIPTIFGKYAPYIISILMFLSYLLFVLVSQRYSYLVPAIVIGILSAIAVFFIPKLKEYPIFMLYGIFSFIVIFQIVLLRHDAIYL